MGPCVVVPRARRAITTGTPIGAEPAVAEGWSRSRRLGAGGRVARVGDACRAIPAAGITCRPCQWLP